VFELADRGHDVTVYPWERPPDDAAIDADISIRPLELSGYPYHSAFQLNDALRKRVAEFAEYDVVHSYVMNSMPVLGEIAARTSAATVGNAERLRRDLPENDLRYMDREPLLQWGWPSTACSLATSGSHDEDGPLYRSASRLGYLKLIREGERMVDEIDAYHAPHHTSRPRTPTSGSRPSG